MNFLRTFFATVLGTLTAFSLIIIFGLLILSGIASIFNSSTLIKNFSSKSVLNLNFNLPIVERKPPFSEIQNFLGLDEDIIGLPNILFASSNFFNEGLSLYEKKEFDKAKFKFEQDIVFNPKSELSYLYLSKIFNKQDKKNLEEKNLNTVMLLNPKNEEAVYNLARLKLTSSD